MKLQHLRFCAGTSAVLLLLQVATPARCWITWASRLTTVYALRRARAAAASTVTVGNSSTAFATGLLDSCPVAPTPVDNSTADGGVLKVEDMVGLWESNPGDCSAAKLALEGMGIPHTVHTAVGGSYNLICLTNADGSGKYSAIVICTDRLAYPNVTQEAGGVQQVANYPSALSESQWANFENYQLYFGVRRVAFGVWPDPSKGVHYPPFGACCNAAEHGTDDQLMSITAEAASLVGFAGIKPSAKLSMAGIQHYPTTMYDGEMYPNYGTAVPIIQFSSTPNVFKSNDTWIGGVVTTYPNGMEEMNFFTPFGAWSTGSVVVQHLWIQWALRSAYPGYRRAYLIAQVDDLFLSSPITTNLSAPASPYLWDFQNQTSYEYRITLNDVLIHRDWQRSLNKRLPTGSQFVLEFAFNGNGVLLQAASDQAIHTAMDESVSNKLLFKKPVGTGTDKWPASPTKFSWAQSLLSKDPLYYGFLNNANLQNEFYWVHHTFTHMELNNATYSDTAKEIDFNKDFAKKAYFGLEGKSVYSANSLVPPAITGLLNGDALRAFKDNNILYVCGDNTRLELVNIDSPFHPLISTGAANGFDEIVIIPRFATNIYYNVSTVLEEEYLYNTIYFHSKEGQASWRNIYDREAARVTGQVLALHPDAYMFHQANMRAASISTSAAPYFPNGRFSLLMLWTEMVFESLSRYVSWPFISRPMREMAQIFLDRQNRDTCGASMRKLIKDGKLVAIEVTGGKKSCTWPISVPGSVNAGKGGWKVEQLSPVDPLTVWVPTEPGITTTINLDTPVPWPTGM